MTATVYAYCFNAEFPNVSGFVLGGGDGSYKWPASVHVHIQLYERRASVPSCHTNEAHRFAQTSEDVHA